MTLTVFRTPWAALLLSALGVALSFALGVQPWRGDHLLSLDWVLASLVLVSAPLAGVAALEAALRFGRGSSSLFASERLRRAVVPRWLGTTLLATLLPLVLAWAVTWVWASPPATAVALSLGMSAVLAVGGTTLVLLFALLCGVLLGPRLGTAAAFLVVLAVCLLPSSSKIGLVYLGGADSSLVGLRLAPGTFLLQLVLVLLVGAGLVWGFDRAGDRSRAAGLAALGGFTAVALLAPLLPMDRYDYREMTGEDFVCAGPPADRAGGFPVCLTREHAWAGQPLVEQYARIHAEAKAAGVTGMELVMMEGVPRAEPPRDAFVAYTFTPQNLDFREGQRVPVSDEDLVGQLVQPPWCPALWTEAGPEQRYEDQVERSRTALLRLLQESDPKKKSEAAAEFNESWDQVIRCAGAE